MISLLGFLAIPVVSFLTDHFELFGLRQAVEYALDRPMSKPEFKERSLYRKTRHPMMLAFLVAFWATPHMTAGHLLFAALMTSYILVGVYSEEEICLTRTEWFTASTRHACLGCCQLGRSQTDRLFRFGKEPKHWRSTPEYQQRK